MKKPYSKQEYLKSPLNYIGGKYKLLPQILPLFPKDVEIFVDLFCGGLNITLNYPAKKSYCNDNLCYLIELYRFLQTNSAEFILQNIAKIIKLYKLDKQNKEGYNALRTAYNANKSPILLFVLIAFGFNHQIRFNNAHCFNTPFGKNRSSFNEKMHQNLISLIDFLQKNSIEFLSLDFREVLESIPINTQSFVYADPPYLLTQGTYNDGKRGFSGWNEKLEQSLLLMLEKLHKKDIKFALSNVLTHKNMQHTILKEWFERHSFFVHHLNAHYSNANYQAKFKDKGQTKEVLITNYSLSELA